MSLYTGIRVKQERGRSNRKISVKNAAGDCQDKFGRRQGERYWQRGRNA